MAGDERQRVLAISQMLPYPVNTGALQRIANLLRGVARDHDLDLVTFYQRALLADTHTVDEGLKVVGEYCDHVDILPIPSDGRPLRWYGLLAGNAFSPRPFAVSRFRSAAMERAVRRRLQEASPSVVHIETIGLAPYALMAESLPKVMVHHNVESSLLLRRSRNERNPLAKAYLGFQGVKLRRYERLTLPRFDANVAVSELDAEELRALAPTARVEVVPNGTDTEFFQPTRASGDPVLVFAGAMTWYPNHDAMVWFTRDVLPRIKARVPNVKLWIIGRGAGEELERLAAAEPAVEMLGFVDDVRDHVGPAAVYVVPIRVGGGTRLKILDAMAMGKAVVSTTIGAEGLELAPERDLLLADSAENFADAVIAVLSDAGRRESLERAGRTTVERTYGWNVIAPRLSRLYAELAAARR